MKRNTTATISLIVVAIVFVVLKTQIVSSPRIPIAIIVFFILLSSN